STPCVLARRGFRGQRARPSRQVIADGAAERQTAATASRRSLDRTDPEKELLVLQEQDRRGRLEGRQSASPLRLREREDSLAPYHGRLPAAPAAGRRGGGAGARDGVAAVRRRGPAGATRRPGGSRRAGGAGTRRVVPME